MTIDFSGIVVIGRRCSYRSAAVGCFYSRWLWLSVGDVVIDRRCIQCRRRWDVFVRVGCGYRSAV